MKSGSRAVWFDRSRPEAPQAGFRSGEASLVVVGADGLPVVHPRTERLSPNTTHALLGHGVAEALDRLGAGGGPVGSGRDALLLPGMAEPAARIFYEADRRTYGSEWRDVVFLAARSHGPLVVEYRIAVDNREYQRGLSRLQHLASLAAFHGHGLRLRI